MANFASKGRGELALGGQELGTKRGSADLGFGKLSYVFLLHKGRGTGFS